MKPAYWKKVKAVLSEAVAVSPSVRPDFFRRVCGDDLKLRREVESLLEFEEPGYCVLDDPRYSLTASTIFAITGSDPNKPCAASRAGITKSDFSSSVSISQD